MSVDGLIQGFVEATSDAIVIGRVTTGAVGVSVVYGNGAFCGLVGGNAPVGPDINLVSLHTDETWRAIMEFARADPTVNSTFTREALLTRPNGERIWVSLTCSAITGADDDARYIVLSYRDISHLKREVAEAKDDHARIVSALDAYPDPIVIYDSELKLQCWNTGYANSITGNPADLVAGMHLRDVLAVAAQSGNYMIAAGQETDWIDDIVSPDHLKLGWEDVELRGDVHHRLLRSRSSRGDFLVIRLNSTEFVRQRREAEEARARLVAALNAYPAPFAIYDSQDCLVVWNDAYADSMANDPTSLYAGMHRTEAAKIAIRSGKIAGAIGNEEKWMSDEHQDATVSVPIQDLELSGDIHHRLLRSRAENGDLVILRIDTTELVRQRRALEATQERLISAINAYPDPFAIYDADQNLVVWNPAYAHSMTDKPEDLRAGINLKQLLLTAARCGRFPAAVGREAAWVEEYCTQEGLKPGTEDFEYTDDQHFRVVRSRAENGEHLVLRMNVTEVVRQRRAVEEYAQRLEVANSEITFKALHDELTGLGNRRHLAEKFDEFVARRSEDGGEIAALHVDLDRFKQINDTMGHGAGDQVLIESAARISARAGSQDVVARIGGDEFVVLMYVPRASDRPQKLAKTLLEDLARPVIFDRKACRFGASIGLAQTPLSDVGELLTNSDVALYKAKRRGRGQLGYFDRSDLNEVRRVKELADDILRGIEGREFIPFYQPQTDAKTGEVVGLEALARWNHPDRGILAPDQFLDVATDLNVAADIDAMIFERAMEECTEAFGSTECPLSLSFNVSARRVSENDFDAVRERVNAYSGQVCFELLETIFLEEEDDGFLLNLDRLRDLGICIEVDDFGSGRASVVALQRIAPHRLKIDRRLVPPVTENKSGWRLLRSIVDIGHAMEIGVTAEGVETQEQAQILADLGCDRLQGYFIAKPMAFNDLLQFLDASRRDIRKLLTG